MFEKTENVHWAKKGWVLVNNIKHSVFLKPTIWEKHLIYVPTEDSWRTALELRESEIQLDSCHVNCSPDIENSWGKKLSSKLHFSLNVFSFQAVKKNQYVQIQPLFAVPSQQRSERDAGWDFRNLTPVDLWQFERWNVTPRKQTCCVHNCHINMLARCSKIDMVVVAAGPPLQYSEYFHPAVE